MSVPSYKMVGTMSDLIISGEKAKGIDSDVIPSTGLVLSGESQLVLSDRPQTLELGAVTDDGSSWNGLHLGRPRVRMLDYAAEQERELDQQVGYSARLFAQVALPQRNPGAIDHYERRNGNVVLTISPALITLKDGSRVRRFPYGIFSRLALTHVATQAVKTQSPVVDLGRSMRNFLSILGIEYSGRNADTVKVQLQALFGAQLSVEGLTTNEAGYGVVSEYYQIAKHVQLWWANKESDTSEGLWSSEVKLSKDFYDSIVQAPVPVDFRALRALGGSSLRMDIYLWATYRVYYLTRPTYIKWADLNNQFGAQYTRLRSFRAAFVIALKEVQIVYPKLNAEVTEDYLILYPSLTHVPSNKPQRQVAAKA